MCAGFNKLKSYEANGEQHHGEQLVRIQTGALGGLYTKRLKYASTKNNPNSRMDTYLQHQNNPSYNPEKGDDDMESHFSFPATHEESRCEFMTVCPANLRVSYAMCESCIERTIVQARLH